MDQHDRTSRRALVVDDHDGVRQLIAAFIRDDYEVSVARDGFEGLAMLQASAGEPFDLVITDVEMPGLSGLEMILVAIEQMPRLNVLFVTAQPTTTPERAAISRLRFPVLSKPFGIDEFTDALRLALTSALVSHGA